MIHMGGSEKKVGSRKLVVSGIDSNPSTKLDKLLRILEEFRDEELKNMFPAKVNPRDRLFLVKSIVAGHDPILLHESSGKPDPELSTESHTSCAPQKECSSCKTK